MNNTAVSEACALASGIEPLTPTSELAQENCTARHECFGRDQSNRVRFEILMRRSEASLEGCAISARWCVLNVVAV